MEVFRQIKGLFAPKSTETVIDGHRQLSRRDFVRGVSLVVTGAALSACALEPTPDPAKAAAAPVAPTAAPAAPGGTEPTKAPAPTAAPAATEPIKAPPSTPPATPKPTEGPKPTEIPLVEPPIINAELLRKLYSIPQDPTKVNVPTMDLVTRTIKPAPTATPSKETPIALSMYWRKPINPSELVANPTQALLATVASAEFEAPIGLRKFTVTESPGKDWLTIARFAMTDKSPTKPNPITWPPGTILDLGANAMIVGTSDELNEELGTTKTVLLVVFDSFTRDKTVPILAFAAIEMTDENIQLLRENGVAYEKKGNINIVTIPSAKEQKDITTPIAKVEKTLAQDLLKEMGVYYFDHFTTSDDKQEINPFPIVSSPDKTLFPTGTNRRTVKYQPNLKDHTVTAVDEKGTPFAVATYNPKKAEEANKLNPDVKAWEWKKYNRAEETFRVIKEKKPNSRFPTGDQYDVNSYITANNDQITIAVGGKNGFTVEQAQQIKTWLDWAMQKAPDIKKFVEDSSVAYFAAVTGLEQTKKAARPNYFSLPAGKYVTGVDFDPNYAFQTIPTLVNLKSWFLQGIFHEVSRIYNGIHSSEISKGIQDDAKVFEYESKLHDFIYPFLTQEEQVAIDSVLAVNKKNIGIR